MEKCLLLGVPNIAIITGEGGSGGAIAIAAANRVLILEHAIYSVITPEGANSIIWRGARTPADAAKAMKITAQDLLGMKIVDRIIPEPAGGAHSVVAEIMASVGEALEAELKALEGFSPEALKTRRAERFYAIGRTGLQ
jgi:acetyl-CoA carboxylase carboxyl transferase subunit alpha